MKVRLTALAGVVCVVFLAVTGLSFQADDVERYETIVVFRNDDVTGFSEDFEGFNSIFVENEVPVSHAVIPESVEKSGSMEEECRKFRELQIKHPETVEYSAHGYNHDGYEFRDSDFQKVQEKLDSTNNFFTECMDQPPKVFVPPQNSISTTSNILVNGYGYHVVSGYDKSRWQQSDAVITSKGEEAIDRQPLELGMTEMFVKSWEDPVTFHNMSVLKSSFDRSYEENRIHVQVVHYKPLKSSNSTERLEKLIDYMEGHEDVKFSSFEDISELFKDDRIRSVEDGWEIKEK